MADLHLDRRVERAADEVLHALEQNADVDGMHPEILPPGKREQPLHERRCPAGCLKSSIDQPLRRVVWRQSPAQQVEVADHRSEQVVEVVGDAAGQLSKRLKLLRLVKLGERKLVVARAFLDARLERLVGISQPLLALLECFEAGARVILAKARPERCRARLTSVVGWNGRSRNVTLPSASSRRPRLGIALESSALAREKDERQIRPFWLSARSMLRGGADRGRAVPPR